MSQEQPIQNASNQTEEEQETGMGLSLNLEEEEEEEEEQQQDIVKSDDKKPFSPSTELRYKYDVNSPKGKNKVNWSEEETDKTDNKQNENENENTNSALSQLVTQVSRDDPNKQISKLEQNDDTQNILMEETNGFCACFSCLWCCGTSEIPSKGKAELARVESDDNKDKLLVKKQPDNNNNNNKDLVKSSEEPSKSESSTVYDGNLLGEVREEDKGKKCLVLDLDETLVHSSFRPIPNPDFIIPVEIDHVVHNVYVMKRPYVDEFMKECAKHYEVVIFTASLSKYANPLLDKLDIHKTISHRLFRESCVIHGTAYVKDLRKLGRKLKDTIIVDNSPPSYLFQPECAVPILSWFDDKSDTQLKDFIPVLQTTLKHISDVRKVLDANNKSFEWLCQQANKPLDIYN